MLAGVTGAAAPCVAYLKGSRLALCVGTDACDAGVENRM